jgi:hypothetical protein
MGLDRDLIGGVHVERRRQVKAGAHEREAGEQWNLVATRPRKLAARSR